MLRAFAAGRYTAAAVWGKADICREMMDRVQDILRRPLGKAAQQEAVRLGIEGNPALTPEQREALERLAKVKDAR